MKKPVTAQQSGSTHQDWAADSQAPSQTKRFVTYSMTMTTPMSHTIHCKLLLKDLTNTSAGNAARMDPMFTLEKSLNSSLDSTILMWLDCVSSLCGSVPASTSLPFASASCTRCLRSFAWRAIEHKGRRDQNCGTPSCGRASSKALG